MLGHTWALRKEQVFAYCLSPYEAMSSSLNDSQPFVEHASCAKRAMCTSVKWGCCFPRIRNEETEAQRG